MTSNVRRFLLIGLVVACAAVVVAWTSISPSSDRHWIPEQARLPEASIRGDSVRIRNVRDFTYTARQNFTSRYDDRDYDLGKLVSVWYVLTPFTERWRGPASSVDWSFRRTCCNYP